jgi:AcrR family transcriptional regulator
LSSAAEARSAEILTKIRSVFGQKGFDGASMQDLARAAGMSVGNFYRYFESKDAIVAALVQQDLGEVAAVFRHILASDDPRGAFLAALRRELESHARGCDGPLWAEIEAASGRRPEICAITSAMEDEVVRFLTRTIALIAGVPDGAASERFETHARFVIVLFKGVAMHTRATPGLIDLAVQTVERLLDDIAATSSPRRHGAAAASR